MTKADKRRGDREVDGEPVQITEITARSVMCKMTPPASRTSRCRSHFSFAGSALRALRCTGRCSFCSVRVR